MQSLRRADHIPNGICLQIVDSVINRRDIGGRVVKPTIALANDNGLVCKLRYISKENADCAFADLCNFRFEQTIDHTRQAIVVETFAALDVVMDVEKLIGALELF